MNDQTFHRPRSDPRITHNDEGTPKDPATPWSGEMHLVSIPHWTRRLWKKWADEIHSLAFVYRETTRGKDVTNDCSPAGGAEKATGLDRGL